MFPASMCPHCGKTLGGERPTSAITDHEFGRTVEMIIPATFCGDDHEPASSSASDSADGADGWRQFASSVATARGEGGPDTATDLFEENGESAEYDPLASPVPDPVLEAFVTTDDPPSSLPPRADPTTGLDLAFLKVEPGPAGVSSGLDEPRGDTGPDDGPEGRRSWAMVLLASYASASTLALAYLIWTRPRPRPEAPDSLPPAARLAPSRSQTPPEPIPEDRVTTIGRPLTVGSLEIMPLSVRTETVELESAVGGGSGGGGDEGGDGDEEGDGTRDGGSAPVLRLLLRNRSDDRAFAPLEPSLVRASDAGVSETFLQTEAGTIGPYPLAVASERAILGQGFAPLGPGEEAEAILVADRDSSSRFTQRMTWRLKLRVGPEETAILGVRFSPEDVH